MLSVKNIRQNHLVFYLWLTFVSLSFLIVTAHVNADQPVMVTDFKGNLVQLEKPAQRVVALGPHIVENIFTAGAGDLLVGVTDYSDYPEAAKSILRVGGYQGYSVETILNLSPDLIFVWSTGVPEKTIQKLRDLGFAVYLDAQRELEDISKAIKDIGLLTGRQVTANLAATQYLEALSSLKEKYQSKSSVSVLFQVVHKPLQTLSDDHMVSDVIRLCGGKNIVGNTPVIAPKVSFEMVLQQNPDVILSGGEPEGYELFVNQWSTWSSLAAVQNNQLYLISPDLLMRQSVRILKGAELLCDKLELARGAVRH